MNRLQGLVRQKGSCPLTSTRTSTVILPTSVRCISIKAPHSSRNRQAVRFYSKQEDFELDDLIASLSKKKSGDSTTNKDISEVDISDIFDDVNEADSPAEVLVKEYEEDNSGLPEVENWLGDVPQTRKKVALPAKQILNKEKFLEQIREEKRLADERKRLPGYKTLTELKFARFYPREVLNWIEDMKTPVGHFSNDDTMLLKEANPLAPPNLSPNQLTRYFRYGQDADFANEDLDTDLDDTLEDWCVDQNDDPHPFGEGGRRMSADPGWTNLNTEIHYTSQDEYDTNEPETFWEDIEPQFRGHYRFGIKPDELKNVPNKVKVILSYKYASSKEKSQFLVKQAMRPFMKHERDHGAPGAMAMAAHLKVEALQHHMTLNPGDAQSRHRYQKALSHRSKIVKYFRRRDPANYFLYLRQTGQKDIMLVK